MPSARLSVPALDEILGEPFSVLDQGFVRVVDYMGSDESIVQAARVSYGRGTKRLQEDRGLIRYLMRHRHTTPFEMCELKLHVRVPMDCWRQWIRHRTANINEYSTRYSEAVDAAQETPPDGWRQQSASNKQGSGEPVDASLGATLSREEAELQQRAREVYYGRLSAGIAREQARKDLPLSTYTEAYWKIDLHNLLHFLELRMDERAQFEIRQYARTIGDQIVRRWCPITWEAFLDYRVESQSLSRLESEVLRKLIAGRPAEARQLAERFGWLDPGADALRRHREREDCEAKIRQLGLTAPWGEE